MERRGLRHRNYSLRAAATAALAGVLLATSPAAAATIYNLGTLGGTSSFGYGINNAGQVTGASEITGTSFRHAFRYDGNPGSGGVMRDLGTLGGDWVQSYGYGVNDAGQVVGSCYTAFNLSFRAFRYDGTPGGGGVMHDLGTLGGALSDGQAINNVGQVAGYSYVTLDAAHAFRYDGTPGGGGVMRDLGTLGGTSSYGKAINDAGQVTGNSNVAGNTAARAFRYDGTPGSGGIMRDLGTLGGTFSQGLAINNAGQVVGASEVAGDPDDHAFLYTGTPGVDGRMIDLDAWLDANDPAEGAKWTLGDAGGLSETGWITGTGTYDPDGPGGVASDFRAYLLDARALVPEPGGLAPLAASGALAVRRRRRHRSAGCNGFVAPFDRGVDRRVGLRIVSTI